jgi:hypothetical protein
LRLGQGEKREVSSE